MKKGCELFSNEFSPIQMKESKFAQSRNKSSLAKDGIIFICNLSNHTSTSSREQNFVRIYMLQTQERV